MHDGTITITSSELQSLIDLSRYASYPHQKINDAMTQILRACVNPPDDINCVTHKDGLPSIYYNELFRACRGVKRGTFAAAVGILAKRGVIERKDGRTKVGGNPAKKVTFLGIAQRHRSAIRKYRKYVL